MLRPKIGQHLLLKKVLQDSSYRKTMSPPLQGTLPLTSEVLASFNASILEKDLCLHRMGHKGSTPYSNAFPRCAVSMVDMHLGQEPGTAGRKLVEFALQGDHFDQILTKSDKIFTIYVKIHQIHDGNFQGRHFLRKKINCGNANTSHRG